MPSASNLAPMLKAEAVSRHFLDIDDIETFELRAILNFARQLKQEQKHGKLTKYLQDKHLALVFEKPSTRTRVSFEVAMHHLGGFCLMLDSQSTQLGRGETVADTARVLSRYVDAIMLRCFQHETLKEMAQNASIPVINGLTDFSHPCQLMADLMTFEEHRGSIEGKIVTWIGDCNNMANSWIQAALRFKFNLHLACPQELATYTDLPSNITLFSDPEKAVEGADLVTTDTWASMGDADSQYKRGLLQSFQVNDELMALAKKDALFMHCLPAHRGEEVTDSIIDGNQSVVWDEAENRLHVQKAILVWCFGKIPA